MNEIINSGDSKKETRKDLRGAVGGAWALLELYNARKK